MFLARWRSIGWVHIGGLQFCSDTSPSNWTRIFEGNDSAAADLRTLAIQIIGHGIGTQFVLGLYCSDVGPYKKKKTHSNFDSNV